MSLLTARAAAPTRAATVRTLALVEARRYSRHPLFLIGAALLLGTMVIASKDLAKGTSDTTTGLIDAAFMPAFFLGLLGVFVGVQLTRSMATATEPVQASPTDGVGRTAALCLATLVSGVAAIVWLVWIYAVSAAWPSPPTPLTAGDVAAIRGAAVVYAVGGPLFGVMVGRWTRFPGAGLLAAVVLYGWVLLSTLGLAMSASRLGTLIYLNAPFVGWVSSDSPHADPWVAGGSPFWHLVYCIALCALAASAAMLHEASERQRPRLVRAFAGLAIMTLVSLVLAVAPDPTRIPL